MRLARIITVIATTLAAAGFIRAQTGDVRADDAQRDPAPITSAVKASAPFAGSAIVKKEGKNRPALPVTPEREAAVLNFVQRNHAELADLLAVLKVSQPEEYERALREIFRATERMNQIQERDPLQYELEVAAWTAQSRVQLLAAKLKMNESEELIKQLRDGLKAQNAAKIALLKHERQKAADRMSKLDSDIGRYESGQDSLIDQQLRLLTRGGESRPTKLLPKTLPKTNVKAKANTSGKK
jgi:flagellar motility protein MotE (MotC chaperone)